MVIRVCVGSACHIKGSYEVIEAMKMYLREHGKESEVELKSSFCLGRCGGAVSVAIDDKEYLSVAPEDVPAQMDRLFGKEA